MNCKYECFLFYTQMEVFKIHNNSCQPWFLPKSNDSIKICDPWESYDFFTIMSTKIQDHICSHCFPDCNAIMYKQSLTVQPFDTCNTKNLGVNRFCTFNFKNPTALQTKINSQIQNESMDSETGWFDATQSYLEIFEHLYFNIRVHDFDIFKKVPYNYDCFDKDIAMVQIISQKSTSVLMGSKQTMTWIDYFAEIGGLLGLVMGMGFVTFIEIIWLCSRIALNILVK